VTTVLLALHVEGMNVEERKYTDSFLDTFALGSGVSLQCGA
jgi:hypothetical protein